jgi:hypothetical protein
MALAAARPPLCAAAPRPCRAARPAAQARPLLPLRRARAPLRVLSKAGPYAHMKMDDAIKEQTRKMSRTVRLRCWSSCRCPAPLWGVCGRLGDSAARRGGAAATCGLADGDLPTPPPKTKRCLTLSAGRSTARRGATSGTCSEFSSERAGGSGSPPGGGVRDGGRRASGGAFPTQAQPAPPHRGSASSSSGPACSLQLVGRRGEPASRPRAPPPPKCAAGSSRIIFGLLRPLMLVILTATAVVNWESLLQVGAALGGEAGASARTPPPARPPRRSGPNGNAPACGLRPPPAPLLPGRRPALLCAEHSARVVEGALWPHLLCAVPAPGVPHKRGVRPGPGRPAAHPAPAPQRSPPRAPCPAPLVQHAAAAAADDAFSRPGAVARPATLLLSAFQHRPSPTPNPQPPAPPFPTHPPSDHAPPAPPPHPPGTSAGTAPARSGA